MGAAIGAYFGAGTAVLGGASNYKAEPLGPADRASSPIDNNKLNASAPDVMPIPEDVRQALAPFFNDPVGQGGVDFNSVTLHKGVPWLNRIFGATAYTSGNDIYWDPNYYVYRFADGTVSRGFIGMVGHELVHVYQYSLSVSTATFQMKYIFRNFGDGGYEFNRYEAPAKAVQRQILGL